MAKGGKKKGPPYDDPGSKYIVVIDPWGMGSAKERGQEDVNRLGSWVTFMLSEQSDRDKDILVEAVYMRQTRNEVIVQLPLNTNLAPLIGEHRWPEFLKWKPKNSSCTASYIFEYKYNINGEPGNHGWADYYPETRPPFPAFKVEDTYPRAHYVGAARFSHLRDLISPLPKERERTPTPPPTDNLFTPYEPPAHHPTHSTLYPEIKTESSKSEVAAEHGLAKIKLEKENERPQEPHHIEKYDPYDEEDIARQALRSDRATEQLANPSSVVKHEETPVPMDDYQPSDALLGSFAMLEQSRVTTSHQQDVAVKTEPQEGESEYRPSNALLQSFAMLEQNRLDHGGQSVTIKAEPQQDRVRLSCQQVAVKPEPEAASLSKGYTPSDALTQAFHQLQSQHPAPSASYTTRVKAEPAHPSDRMSVPIPMSPSTSSTTTNDPRRRPPSYPPKRPKEEEDRFLDGFTKKAKIERY